MSEGRDIGAYEESGRGYVANERELENKFETYEFKDDNPERTAEQKEAIRRIEHEKAEYMKEHGLETDPPKKEGLLKKLIPGKHKDKTEEPEHTHHEGDAKKGIAGEEEGSTGESKFNPSDHGFRTDAQGNILIQNTSSHPDDPHLVIK